MTGRRNKIIEAVAVLIVLAAVLFLFQSGQFNPNNLSLSGLTSLFDETTLRLVTVGLIVIVTMLAIGLLVLARRSEVRVGYTETRRPFADPDDERRGRGRPRKPCNLALTGAMTCPLEPDLEIDPDYIARVSAAVADLQHDKLTSQEKPETAQKNEQPAKTEKPEKTEPEEKPSETEEIGRIKVDGEDKKESVGGLMTDLAEVLVKRKKDDKKAVAK